jgi:NADH-quinone oxidoreductase subunit C
MAEEQKPEGAAKPPAAAPAAPKAPAALAATPWESDLTRQLQEAFPDQVTELVTTIGQSSLVVKPDAVIPVLEYLKLEGEFDYLVDITAVDYPAREDRFDVVYILYSFARNERIRIKARIALGYKPATAIPVYATADWLEREVFDMFGIEFANHPNMRRILLPEEWEGFPLRKDYGIIQMDNRWVKENLGIESGQ